MSDRGVPATASGKALLASDGAPGARIAANAKTLLSVTFWLLFLRAPYDKT